MIFMSFLLNLGVSVPQQM